MADESEKPLPPDVIKMRADHEAIREAIIGLHFAWGALETTLASLLGHITDHGGKPLGSAIYYAPGGAETRFDIVDRAYTAFLDGLEEGNILWGSWATFFKKLSACRVSRNSVVHGSITTVHVYGKNHARLTPPMLDRHRWKLAPGQLPGMSAHDVAEITTKTWWVGKWARTFEKAVKAIRENDEPTLQEKLRELEDYPQKQDGRRSSDQMPPAPQAPPES